ncbi:hypothetical protein FRB94_011977 [Tulasnella sp. JGI-2019a]|nr:hypothetical protein FRB93_012741 [Tulasnella sp. JGI-2019a]KAG9009560.1 hypothetical protein FRB94_011977 [Tulasnella sp. JGI-2019a]KAG9034526.1 hypothetical protein FRB95_013093 [Tulasnella sp. JGI-2019a]
MDTLKYVVVDAFTTIPLTGNPAAVIVLPPATNLPDALALKIAAEFNLSETAFLLSKSKEGETEDSETITYGLRWFTPTTEIVLCGHGTLASAKVLFEEPGLIPERVTTLRFETLSGILTAKKVSGGQIELEFPVADFVAVGPGIKARVIEAVTEALGSPVAIHDIHKGGIFLMIRLEESFNLEGAVVNASPFLKLTDQCLGVILTSQHPSAIAPHAKFVSRAFGPALGSNEDPVCGSAHCLLAPYWSQLLMIPPGEVIPARQVSPRGGDLDIIWEKAKGTVKIRGRAVFTARGEMYI